MQSPAAGQIAPAGFVSADQIPTVSAIGTDFVPASPIDIQDLQPWTAPALTEMPATQDAAPDASSGAYQHVMSPSLHPQGIDGLAAATPPDQNAEVVVTARKITPWMVYTYNVQLAIAAYRHPGPSAGPLRVPAIQGTHYAGNGVNDASNKAFATAKALGITHVGIYNVDDFIDESKWSPGMRDAMSSVLQQYYSMIGGYQLPSGSMVFNDASYIAKGDLFGNVPTSPVDFFALQHDLEEVGAANTNVFARSLAQAAADTHLAQGAYKSMLSDTFGSPADQARVITDYAIYQFANVARDFQLTVELPNPKPLIHPKNF